MTPRRPHAGFVLIELVTTLVLVGVIGTFAGFFLWNGINGYLASKRNSETALAAQVALDRISFELRHIASLSRPDSPSRAEYIDHLSAPPSRTSRESAGCATTPRPSTSAGTVGPPRTRC